ncbi:MAG TPA: SRPBCC family protein [Acidimicrobiales bacterium]|nr:SRPBCC family protein [Acidimicrobiales bacterium]
MATITVRATYPVAPEVVWEELSHLDRHVHWMSDAVAIEFANDQHEGVGTSFRCTTKVGPLVTHDLMTITRWDPPRAMGVTHVGLVKGSGSFTLDGTTSTELTWRETLTFPWWGLGPLGALVAAPVLRALWAANLRRLGARVS